MLGVQSPFREAAEQLNNIKVVIGAYDLKELVECNEYFVANSKYQRYAETQEGKVVIKKLRDYIGELRTRGGNNKSIVDMLEDVAAALDMKEVM